MLPYAERRFREIFYEGGVQHVIPEAPYAANDKRELETSVDWLDGFYNLERFNDEVRLFILKLAVAKKSDGPNSMCTG